ncbi:VP4 [Gokushovirus WZ-2015a]|nr:VP4 [Gokushovirus WZ-2015a]
MSCYKPLIRIYNPDDKEISGQVYSLARFSERMGKKLRYEDLMYEPRVMLIPCGQCIGCRIRQREDWTTRIELEARQWPKERVWFITLTYDDEHVPGMILKTGELLRKAQYVWKPGEEAPKSVQTLLYTDVQKFLKRLRKAYKAKLRFFCAGEYGEQTARPHYHMILYGWEPTDLKQLYKIHHNGYYTSEWMASIWGMGQIQIAQATPETYRYVAGYVTKKMYEIDGEKANVYYKLGQQKPFACMSLKPGLGDAYYQEHKAEIWRQGYIQCTNGKRAQIPRYYEKMMEKENPERLWRIKRRRQKQIIEQNLLKYENTDFEKDLKSKERVIKKSMKVRKNGL